MNSWLLPTIIYLLFCASHSVLAEIWVKEWFFKKAPWLPPYYRMLYSLISLVLLAAWYITIPFNGQILYHIQYPFNLIAYSIQLVAVLGFLKSLFNFETGVFLGTTQIKNYWKQKHHPEYLDEPSRGELIISGPHRYMRHPLYSFAILFLLANPTLTITTAYLSGCIIFYFWIGSIFEERKLITRFGDTYRKYQETTGRFLPVWWK